ncbi:MAG TPA: BON domain-containing protein [Chitinophagaceae bacterium]|nr:BON domain-containing protein [Chitinophagaceae bacterium]
MKLKKLNVIVLAGLLCTCGFVACNSKPSDADIQTEVNKKLADEAGSGLTASVSKGVVTLSGTCKDEECRRECAEEVKDVKGVTNVVNNISVPVATAPVEIAPDATLQEAANNVVKAYSDVKAEVKDGVVTLRGQIERSKLQDLMSSLHALKPKKVENQLVIK